MADVVGAAAAALPPRLLPFSAPAAVAHPLRPGGRVAATLGQLEAQAAGDRIGLGEPQLQALAGREARLALLADQALARLVVAEKFAAEGRDRHQPIAAEPLDRGKEAERLDPG